MKTINYLNITTNLVEKTELKKTFTYRDFNFAIAKKDGCLELVHFESGGKIGMFLPTNKTIKDFQKRSLEAIDTLIRCNGIDVFSDVLNNQKIIN